jgi:hypothetical protein
MQSLIAAIFVSNISEYEANIYSLRSYEAHKKGFIRLFRIEVNQRILHAK